MKETKKVLNKTTKPSPSTNPKTLPPKQKAPIPQNTLKPKKPGYKFVGKTSFKEMLAKALPRELIPTELTAKILGGIFVLVLVHAIFIFPYGALTSATGIEQASLKVGLPFTFFEFFFVKHDGIPLKVKGLIFDLLIYILIAYVLEVIYKIIKRSSSKALTDKGKYPRIYKDMKPKNIAEAVTKKVFKPATPKESINNTTNLLKTTK
jgi:hypothetical protein